MAHASLTPLQLPKMALDAGPPGLVDLEAAPAAAGTCKSRSTSAGSSPPSSQLADQDLSASARLSRGLSRSRAASYAVCVSDQKVPQAARSCIADVAAIGRPTQGVGLGSDRATSCPASRLTSFDDIGLPPGLDGFFDFAEDGTAIAGTMQLEASAGGIPCRLDLAGLETGAAVLPDWQGASRPAGRPTSFDDLGLPSGLVNVLEGIVEGELDDGLPRYVMKSDREPSKATNAADAQHVQDEDQGALQGSPYPATWWQNAAFLEWFSATQYALAAHAEKEVYAAAAAAIEAMHAGEYSKEADTIGVEDPLALGTGMGSISKGSAGHYAGTCKPCVFFHHKGCENGPECPFCHLCPPNERKRRKAERKQFIRSGARSSGGAHGGSASFWKNSGGYYAGLIPR
eukprot:TRINITY_DN12471_c0_g1_i1.p1 TRINITY_DN12471_c0_g1~~TRINITY_DN12471_c0_g1_i1.p1  ORF type:complete len:423 (+),score=57.41 TRINITY_DN12471_c0_g1_i1:67-1269(+)